MGHGRFAVVGYGYVINKVDLINHFYPGVITENSSREQIYGILHILEEWFRTELHLELHVERQDDEAQNVFITLPEPKSIVVDVGGGSPFEIGTNLLPTPLEVNHIQEVLGSLTAGKRCKLFLYAYEGA